VVAPPSGPRSPSAFSPVVTPRGGRRSIRERSHRSGVGVGVRRDPHEVLCDGRAVNIAPVVRSKAAAQETYDRRSRSYERLEGRFERRARITGERLLAVRPRERILEIGSGPGASLAALAAAAGPVGHVVGVDLAPRMHRVAAQRLRGRQLGGRVSLVVADGARIPLRAGSFDAVFACFTLELFDTPELPTVLGEARRVLRRDGRLGIVSLTTSEPPALMERAYLVAHRIMPKLADCRPIPVVTLLAEADFHVESRRRCDIFGIPVVAVVARRGRAGTSVGRAVG
jgi:ubiquinone/menaquinone biosynthesis C-methylase UbiE